MLLSELRVAGTRGGECELEAGDVDAGAGLTAAEALTSGAVTVEAAFDSGAPVLPFCFSSSGGGIQSIAGAIGGKRSAQI
jgi:hypothetical protein